MKKETRIFEGLYFKQGTGQSFIASVVENGTRKAVLSREPLINRVGKWSVEATSTFKGDAYKVTNAIKFYDQFTLSEQSDFSVGIMINGIIGIYKTYRPNNKKVVQRKLNFCYDREQGIEYTAEEICEGFRKKVTHLEIDDKFNLEEFLTIFVEKCNKIDKEYRKYMKNEFKKSKTGKQIKE